MNEINKMNVIDDNKNNSFFKICLGTFLIPINLYLCFSLYFAVTQFFPSLFSFLEHNGKYVVANLISMSIIFGIYYFLLNKIIYRILVILPYSIPIFLIPFEPLSLKAYVCNFITIIVSHFLIMSYIGFKTVQKPAFKQIISYIGYMILGFIILLLVLFLNPPNII